MHKYTFFEEAQQQGYVVSLMGDKMQKSRDFAKIVTADDQQTRVFLMYKTIDPETPVFQFVIPQRTALESQSLWRDRCKMLLDKAWKAYKQARRDARALASVPCTEPTAGSSESPPSSPESSSTEALARLRSLTLASMEADDALMGYGNAGSTPVSSETMPSSSPDSGSTSQSAGSESQSSFTGSTADGGSDTGPLEYTLASDSGLTPSQPSLASSETVPTDSSTPTGSLPRRKRSSKRSASSAKSASSRSPTSG